MGKADLSARTADRLRAALAAAETLHAALSALKETQEMQDGATAMPANAHPPRAVMDAPLAAAASGLTDSQKRVCERVVNVFETGTIAGKYDAISIYADGPGGRRQITYGRSQTTEYGNLRELVAMYVAAAGQYSAELGAYVGKIGSTPLVDNAAFKTLLRAAGADPVMRQTQDLFFDQRYFQPALKWATGRGFTRALSVLVIYDSFIHSGGILGFLRTRFPEKTPDRGGDEKIWVEQYTDVRHAWLSSHSNPAIRASSYRTKDLVREIGRGNWDLTMLPIMANGTPVDDAPTPSAIMVAAGRISLDEPEWCEAEPPPSRAFASVRSQADPVPVLAQSILDNPSIKLATAHVSGVDDDATAHQNIVDTAAGRPASRSSYGNAPGGTVVLDARMLQGLLDLATEYSFEVSELCGASHSPNSRHYLGVTADVNVINGSHVKASHPDQAAFRTRCSELGATEVKGPGDSGHTTHIHAAWPR